MPPRLPIQILPRCCRPLFETQAPQGPLAAAFAALSVQTRSAAILARLRDNKGAYNKRIRVGRGPSSGYGKTAGRGQKGRKAREKVAPWFQGGQTPLVVSKGRRGFENKRAPDMKVVNLDKLQEWIDNGRIDPTKPITPVELVRSGLVGPTIKDGITLLARTRDVAADGPPALRMAVRISVSRASAAAIAAVEAVGGTVATRYYTRSSIQRLVEGKSVHTDEPLPVGKEHVEAVVARLRKSGTKFLYRLPDPTSRRDIEYYRDPAHRGYLSHMLKPGESPSLYYRVPGQSPADGKTSAMAAAAAAAVEAKKKARASLLFSLP